MLNTCSSRVLVRTVTQLVYEQAESSPLRREVLVLIKDTLSILWLYTDKSIISWQKLGKTGLWSKSVMGKLFKEGAKGKEKNFRRVNIIY